MRPFVPVLLALFVAGCHSSSTARPPSPQVPVMKLRLDGAGGISLNGTPATLAQVRAALAGLKAKNGVVWYYRDAAQAEPPPDAMAVLEAVVDARVPISLSTKPDFSDVVGPDGTSHAHN